MKFIKTIMIFSLVFFIKNYSYAEAVSPKQPTFYGTVKIIEGGIPIDSLIIHFYRPNSIISDPISISVRIGANGSFNFKLPYYNKPSTILIQAAHSNKKFTKLDKYFVEPSDEIKMQIISDSFGDDVEFSGKGASKYSIVKELKKIENELTKVYVDLKLYESSNFNSIFNRVDEIVKSSLERKSQILSLFNLGTEMHNMINYEYANIFSKWDYWLYNASLQPSFKTDSNRFLLRNYFNQHKDQYSYKPDDVMALCPIYTINLTARIKFDLIFNSNSDTTNLKEYYNIVKDKYPQSIKNQLLSWSFINPLGLRYLSFDRETIDSLMIDAQKVVEVPFLRQEISEVLKFSKGRGLFDATFTDLIGNKISTNSLKGKVVLIDMWGVGCANCAAFHQMFEKEIHPWLKSRNDFVVLSISMDKSREKWLEGIDSGKYTSKDNLNVFTDGLMFNHPFPKHYNINYSPFIVLIDKNGKIYSRLKGESTPNAILKTINDALQQD